MLKDRFARFKDIQIRLKDIQVASLGGTAAVATAAMTRELGDGVTTITEAGALTVVLRKEGDIWVIVSEHYSYKRST
jgi:ketosteroid isomerase-like protein